MEENATLRAEVEKIGQERNELECEKICLVAKLKVANAEVAQLQEDNAGLSFAVEEMGRMVCFEHCHKNAAPPACAECKIHVILEAVRNAT